MRDLRLVEESLVKTLCGIYHGRVAYPKARKDAEESLPRARLRV
jgi:membrane-associated HD superfamily phosphohydrolase